MHNKRLSALLSLEPFISEVITQTTERGSSGWHQILAAHPSDIADLFESLSDKYQQRFVTILPLPLLAQVFKRLEHPTQVDALRLLDQEQAAHVLRHMPTNDVVDLCEHLGDEEAKGYLNLLQRKQRSRILSLLTFDPKSAAGIMNSDVLTLSSDLTVKKSIDLLQRLRPEVEVRYRIYVVDTNNILVGYLTLDTLVINKPETPLIDLIKKTDLVINAHEDQEVAIHAMSHYDVSSAPVVDHEGHFLGIISASDVFEVIEEEASEDLYRMSGVGHVQHSYLETPLLHMLFERGKWLVPLLLLQSVSSYIMRHFDGMLAEHVIIAFFLTMLTGTGGNAGNQSATLVIRGLATGEINRKDGLVVLVRECGIGFLLAAVLSIISWLRIYLTAGANMVIATAISLSLFAIVVTSMILGTLIPLALERLNIDPAHSAAPFLATVMDIIGIIIYCSICKVCL